MTSSSRHPTHAGSRPGSSPGRWFAAPVPPPATPRASGLEPVRERVRRLSGDLRDRLAGFPASGPGPGRPSWPRIVTVSVGGWRRRDLVHALRARGINTSGQSRSDAVLDYDAKGVDGALRISPHYFNTEEELETFLGALGEIVGG